MIRLGALWIRLKIKSWLRGGVCNRDTLLSGSGSIVDKALGVLRVANNCGERRTFEYEMPLRSYGKRKFRLKGRKLLRYGEVWRYDTRTRRNEDNNLWRSLGRLEVELLAEGSDDPIAYGELALDFNDLVENNERWPQVLSKHDGPSAYTEMASLGLFMLRAMFQIHFWDFRLIYDVPKEADNATTGSTVLRNPGNTGSEISEPFPAERVPTPLPGPLAGLPAPEYWALSEPAKEGQAKFRWVTPITAEVNGKSRPMARRDTSLLLTRYYGTRSQRDGIADRGPLILTHGFAHSTLLFATDSLTSRADPKRQNIVQFLWDAGFDVWLLDLRTSSALPSAWDQWDFDTVAGHDVPAAVRFVLDHVRGEGRPFDQVKVLAHCMGAAVFLIAALEGKLKHNGRSLLGAMVLSQVGLIPAGSKSNRLRGELAAFLRDWIGADHVDVRAPARGQGDGADSLADRLALTYPLRDDHLQFQTKMLGRIAKKQRRYWPRSQELCAAFERQCYEDARVLASSNRVTAIYGHNWNNDNLSAETWRALPEILGVANMETFRQISQFMHHERLVDASGQKPYVDYQRVAAHFDFPILMMQGIDNDVFDRQTSFRTFNLLVRIRRWAAGRLGRYVRALYMLAGNRSPRNPAENELAQLVDAVWRSTKDWLRAIECSLDPKLEGCPQPGAKSVDELRGELDRAIAALGRFELHRLTQNGEQLKDVDIHSKLASVNQLIDQISIRAGDRLKRFKGYVHMDCFLGKNAYQDIYPSIGAFLQRDAFDGDRPQLSKFAPKLWYMDPEGAGPDSDNQDAYWYNDPHLGPILGWTRVETDQLVARIWLKTRQDVVRDDTRYQPAFGIRSLAKLGDGGERRVESSSADALKKLIVVDVSIFRSRSQAGLTLALQSKHRNHRVVLGKMADDEAGLAAYGETESIDDELWSSVELALAKSAQADDSADAARAEQLQLLDKQVGATSGTVSPAEFPFPSTEADLLARQVFRRENEDRDSGIPATHVRISKAQIAGLKSQQPQQAALLLGSCRQPGTFVNRELADAMAQQMVKEIDRAREGGVPLALMLMGDQIYFDATAEMFDNHTVHEKFIERYETAYNSPGMRELMSRIPTYMMLDDHEVFDGWEELRMIRHDKPDPSTVSAMRARTETEGRRAFEGYQWSHGPSPNGARRRPDANGYWYPLKVAGFPVFVMDTRSRRTRSAENLDGHGATLVHNDQFEALETFLKHAQSDHKDVPKFVVIQAPIAPIVKTMCSNAPYAMSKTAGQGFPTRARDCCNSSPKTIFAMSCCSRAIRTVRWRQSSESRKTSTIRSRFTTSPPRRCSRPIRSQMPRAANMRSTEIWWWETVTPAIRASLRAGARSIRLPVSTYGLPRTTGMSRRRCLPTAAWSLFERHGFSEPVRSARSCWRVCRALQSRG